MVMYVWTYLRVAKEQVWDLRACAATDTDSTSHLPQIDFIVPTGAMGNIVAGYMCHQMGLPIRKLVAAVNINDITHQAIQHGTFHRSEHMQRTLSEAINIQVPYNFERLLYYLSNENDVLVQKWYQDLKHTQKITLSESWLEPLQRVFDSARVTDAQLCQAARNVHALYSPYLVDPHTAVAFSAAKQLRYFRDPSSSTASSRPHAVPLVLFATASPCKFEHALSMALGANVWDAYMHSEAFPERARHILQLPEQPYTRYTNNDVEPLITIQQIWEKRTRQLVKNLEQQLTS
jgi:threonine synthase